MGKVIPFDEARSWEFYENGRRADAKARAEMLQRNEKGELAQLAVYVKYFNEALTAGRRAANRSKGVLLADQKGAITFRARLAALLQHRPEAEAAFWKAFNERPLPAQTTEAKPATGLTEKTQNAS